MPTEVEVAGQSRNVRLESTQLPELCHCLTSIDHYRRGGQGEPWRRGGGGAGQGGGDRSVVLVFLKGQPPLAANKNTPRHGSYGAAAANVRTMATCGTRGVTPARSRKPTRKRAERARGGVSKRNKVSISGQDIKQMNTRLFNHNPSYDMADYCRLRPYLSYASSRSPTFGEGRDFGRREDTSRGEMITIR